MTPNFLLSGVAVVLSTALAVSQAFRRRRRASNLFFGAGMFLLGAESIFQGLSLEATSPGQIESWQSAALIVKSLLIAVWFCFSLSYSRGSFSPPSSRKSWLLGMALLLPVSLAFWSRKDLVRALPFSTTDSTSWVSYSLPGKILNVLLLLGAVLILMNLERTLRSAVGTVRWRIKFVILGLGVIFGVRIYTRSQDLLFSGHQLALASVETGAVVVGCLLIGVAYFRHGFKDVDVYPSRAVLHTSLTVLLVGGYLFVVGLLAQLAGQFGGAGSFQLQALLLMVGMVFLAVLFLSEKVRQRIRVFVSRNFKRPQHDVRKVWAQFTACMAGPQDPVVLSQAVATLLSDTFNALSVSIWLAEPGNDRLVLAASTSDARKAPSAVDRNGLGTGPNLQALQKFTRPFFLDNSKEEGAASLRELNAGQFTHGGAQVCVPLQSGEHWLGIAILADRVNGVPYAIEELDLLGCIGDQVAASVLNLRLGSEMAAGKELEAFQAISAFFVHDLKNAASTLGLMLNNLPVHFADPEFRADALRGIGSTAKRINQLISRAGELQQGLTIQPRPVDLNALVSDAVEQLKHGDEISWVKNLRKDLPPLKVDPEQIQSVVTNLLLNAGDAVGAHGKITVETGARDGWAEILVADDGCGMTREFLQKELFRPLRTTKKKGLGIGMFQSKMVVEAHGGKITAVSEPGVGTTFRVLLPLQ